MKQAKKVVSRAILLTENDKVLLGKRVRGGGVGKWALIGGIVEEGETPEHAVVREVEEELGIQFAPQFVGLVEDNISTDRADNEQHSWDIYIYAGTFIGTLQPKPDEISELIEVNSEELDALDIAFNHEDILHNYFANKKTERG